MNIRRAEEKDLPRIDELLSQVLMVHHNARPDLFKANCRKYTDDELEIMAKDKILTLGPIRNYKKIYYDAQGNLIDSQK